MAVRAIRGATQVDVDDKEHVLAVTRELVSEVLEGNKLVPDDVISIIFSTTRDISSVAPALAARQLGLNEPALLCLQEMHVEGALPRLVRLLAHVDTDLTRDQVQNVYLRGTQVLRGDVPAVPNASSGGAAGSDVPVVPAVSAVPSINTALATDIDSDTDTEG